jgi:hypothetical protein
VKGKKETKRDFFYSSFVKVVHSFLSKLYKAGEEREKTIRGFYEEQVPFLLFSIIRSVASVYKIFHDF